MKRYWLFMMLVFLVVSCAGKKTEFFPSQGYSAESAEVTVIREKFLWGLGFSLDVVLDGNVIARLQSGEYVTFYINAGVHDIGTPESTIAVPLGAGRKHYFLIEVDTSKFGFDIEQISAKKAESWVSKSKPIK
jgi:hypothetical protein